MKNTYPMTLTTPRLNTLITVEKLDNDIVMNIEGFGRWLMDDSNKDLFAIGFLPADDQTLEFESLAFFWHDWMEDIMMTEGINGHAVQYEYAMHYAGSHINVLY